MRLTDLERRGLEGKFGGKIKFQADWSAFRNWMREAKHRQGPKGFPAQCSKLDSDLDSAPPVWPPPHVEHHEPEGAAGHLAVLLSTLSENYFIHHCILFLFLYVYLF